MTKKSIRPIPVHSITGRHHTIAVDVNNTSKYTIKRHRQEIKAIRRQARADVRKHKLLIKQAKITARLEQMK